MAEPGAARRVAAWGCLAGIVSLAAGVIGPMFFLPQANLGPLLGIVTAPAGAALGALAGAVWSVRRASKGREGDGLRWLLALELFALLWMYWGFGVATTFAMPALALQALILVVATMLCRSDRSRDHWTSNRRTRVGATVAAGALILALSLLPPVHDVNAGSLRFAFVTDPRFDTRTRVAAVQVDRRLLALEIVAVMAVALVMDRTLRRQVATSAV